MTLGPRKGLLGRCLTVYLDGSYLHGFAGVSGEVQQFGMNFFESMGISEIHIPMERKRDPEVLNAIREHLPVDFVFVCPYEDVEAWIRPIVGPETPILAWFSDSTWRWAWEREWFPHLDYLVTTDADVCDNHRNMGFDGALLSNWACRPDRWILTEAQRPEQFFGASFAGFVHGDRLKRLREIGEAGDVDLIVHDTREKQLPPLNYFQFISSRTFALCLTNSSTGPKQMKARLFEAALQQSILLTESCPRLTEYWQPGEEILVFDTPEKAQRIMTSLLGDQAEINRLRENALERILREHTYQLRFAEIFKAMGLYEEVPDVAADPISEGKA